MEGNVKGRVMPTEVQIEGKIAEIRRYQSLPEKMYKRKILIILIANILLGINYTRLRYGFEGIQSRGLYSYFFGNIFYVVIIVVGFIAYFSLRHLIPDVLKATLGATKGVVKKLNPFHDKGYEDTAYVDAMKGYEERTKKSKKKQGKSEPFMYFRETKAGEALREYLVIIHIIAYPQIWFGVKRWSQVQEISPRGMQIFTLQFILTLVVYKVLSKEPGSTKVRAKKQLKELFDYYCSPDGKPLLSSREKELFEENFKVLTQDYDSHRKGYWSSGVYHNQEFSYWTMLYIEDFKKGYNYAIKYNTDNKHAHWSRVSGTERLTKRGLREVRRS